MSANDEITNAGANIGSGLQDAANAASNSKVKTKALSDSLSDFKGLVKSTGSAFLDSSDELSRFSRITDSANSLISRGASRAFGKGGAAAAGISLASNGLAALVKTLLKYNDNQLSLYDRVAKLGISTGTSADGVHSLIQSSGYWDARFEGFLGSAEKLGTGLISLGNTTSEGAAQLAKILNVTEFEDSFIKLGYSLEGLSKVQTDYIKMQESTGIKIDRDANVVKRNSLAYAESLKVLSAITGQSVDKLSQTMAAQLADTSFAIKIRQMEQSGDKAGAERLKEAATLAEELYGPDTGRAVRDLLANGYATTKQAEGLIIKSRGEAQGWARSIDQNTMDPLELVKNIGKAAVSMDKQFGKSIGFSDQLQSDIDMTAKGVANAYQIADTKTTAELKDIIIANRDKQKSDADLKNVQIAQTNTERAVGMASGEMMKSLNGPLTSALTFLTGTVKSVALFSAQLGNFLFGKQTEAFENVIRAVGDPKDIKNLEINLTSNIRDVDALIAKQKKDGDFVKQRKADYEKATAKQKEVDDRIRNKQSVTERERASTANDLMQARAIYEESKRQEASRYGKSSEELQQERESFVQRRTGTRTAYTERRTEEAQQQNATAFTEDQITKFIQFSGGLSGDLTHFNQLEPEFAKKIVAFAENYNKMTGKKLNLESAYRSPEEQAKLYDAWVAAGGSKDKPIVDTPYGRLKTPAKTHSNHNEGRAVDISSSQLDDNILKQFGLNRPVRGDDVHVEAMPGAKNGGIFDGASSGYPMMFHGTEAIIPMLDGKTVPLALKNASTDTNHSALRSSMAKSASTQTAGTSQAKTTNPAKEFADMLNDKVEQMITRVSASNSIYSDIKLYMSN